MILYSSANTIVLALFMYPERNFMLPVSRTKSLAMALIFCLLAACTQPVAPQTTSANTAAAPQPDLTGIKTYRL
jgi:hypothetical protein